MELPAVDPKKCPTCGQGNACGMAAGKSHCWCFDVKLDPLAVAAIPEAAKGKACLCQTCGRPQKTT